MGMPKTHIEFIEKANRFGVREELVKFVEYLNDKGLITINNMTLHGTLTQAATDFLNEEIIYEKLISDWRKRYEYKRYSEKRIKRES